MNKMFYDQLIISAILISSIYILLLLNHLHDQSQTLGTPTTCVWECLVVLSFTGNYEVEQRPHHFISCTFCSFLSSLLLQLHLPPSNVYIYAFLHFFYELGSHRSHACHQPDRLPYHTKPPLGLCLYLFLGN